MSELDHHEAVQCPVVGINKQGGKATGLCRAVPAVRAVHQHTHTLIMQCLGGNG